MPENPFPRAYILFYELVDRVDGGEVVKMGLSWQKWLWFYCHYKLISQIMDRQNVSLPIKILLNF